MKIFFPLKTIKIWFTQFIYCLKCVRWWFKSLTEIHHGELWRVPQLVAEKPIALNAKYIQVDITTYARNPLLDSSLLHNTGSVSTSLELCKHTKRIAWHRCRIRVCHLDSLVFVLPWLFRLPSDPIMRKRLHTIFTITKYSRKKVIFSKLLTKFPCSKLSWSCSKVTPLITSRGSMIFPNDLLILRPWASRTMAWRYTWIKQQRGKKTRTFILIHSDLTSLNGISPRRYWPKKTMRATQKNKMSWPVSKREPWSWE